MVDRYRRDALSILIRLYEGRIAFLDQAYTACSLRYSPHERDLLVSLVRGVVKFREKLDTLARTYLPKWERLPPVIQNALRLGMFQLLFHTRVPPFAVVHEWVEVVRSFGQVAFVPLVNAVLRNVERDLAAHRAQAEKWGIDLPAWLEAEWRRVLPEEELHVLLRSLALPPPLYIRVNTLRIGEEELQKLLAQRGIPSRRSRISGALEVVSSYSALVRTPEYAQGLFYPQDLGSQVVGHLVAPKSGEVVVDACCGVGGKTLLLAQLMGNEGKLFAWDKKKRRIEVLKGLMRRSGVLIVQPEVLNCLRIPERFWFVADRLLLDAPCSNLGTVRRNPEALLKATPESVRQCASLQLELLREAFQVVRPQGLMVYSVCTLTWEETVGVAEAFEQEKGPALVRVEPEGEVPGRVRDGFVFLWPHDLFCDGFFVAIWRKKA
ncbi:RsmB/NOP family class I SAM-dependent RNA methyltransferase [Candidatus Caldatribacterium saccharofermentans]|uniref:SAM-dependent MTase RsmB/NOP-type domain-containing protein n=1 Tax=Candidatus Caldatribacterium saccharofermentans TaxID=1454753 RepID=A0A7V4WM60_9BACT